MGRHPRVSRRAVGGLEVNHRDAAEGLVAEVHDPGQAALIHAVLALVDAVESWTPPAEPELEPQPGQTAATWDWGNT